MSSFSVLHSFWLGCIALGRTLNGGVLYREDLYCTVLVLYMIPRRLWLRMTLDPSSYVTRGLLGMYRVMSRSSFEIELRKRKGLQELGDVDDGCFLFVRYSVMVDR